MLKEEAASNTAPTQSISFQMKAQQEYVFILSGREEIDQSDLSLSIKKRVTVNLSIYYPYFLPFYDRDLSYDQRTGQTPSGSKERFG